MTTTKKRINISLSPDLDKTLSALAKRDQVPAATKAVELLRVGIEFDEDVLLEHVAHKRNQTTKKFISHKQVCGS